jgi:hypothetical protein
MPLWIVTTALVVCAVSSLIAGIWLLLNMPAVARTFGSGGNIVPPPGRRRVPPRKVLLMIAIFNLGWIAAVAIWIWALSGDANQVIVARP